MTARPDHVEHVGHEREIPPRALLRHCAEVIDTAVVNICEGLPISLAGRKVLAHVADRIRGVAEVIP